MLLSTFTARSALHHATTKITNPRSRSSLETNAHESQNTGYQTSAVGLLLLAEILLALVVVLREVPAGSRRRDHGTPLVLRLVLPVPKTQGSPHAPCVSEGTRGFRAPGKGGGKMKRARKGHAHLEGGKEGNRPLAPSRAAGNGDGGGHRCCCCCRWVPVSRNQ